MVSTPSTWEETTVGDFAPFNYGESLPERLRNSSGNVTVFGSNGIVGRHDEPLLDGPGIIIGRKGTVGAVHFSPGPFWPIDTTFYILPDNRRDIRFTYYLLYALGLESMNSDSAVPGLNRNAAHGRTIVVPPLQEQRAIAAILGVLDDKIELNRQMGKTLEEMTQALFRSWFLDFEPFRDQGMEDSPLGPIPRGWRVGSFGDIISEKRERIGGDQAIVLSAVSKGELMQSDEHFNKRVYSKNINKYLRVEQWDFAYNPSRINIGSIGMLKESLLGAVSPVYVVFRPNLNYHWFIDFALRQNQVIEWINTLASGSVRQSLTFNDFTSIPCVIPPAEFTQAFTERWNIILSMIEKNKETSVTIGNIRDALLPKFLSGEIRVKDAEKFVEVTI